MKLRLVPITLAALAGLIPRAESNWRLVWNDDFSGAAVDSTRWTYDLGTGPPYPGWGNNELEFYTSRPDNVYVTNGLLHIVARAENYSGANYTSARLKTQERFSKAYGRFEFRARLPQGQGLWPAFWLMPVNSVYGAWAASGEMDAMEIRGQDPKTVLGTLHFGGVWPNNTQSFGPPFLFQGGESATNFHIYALEWTTNGFRWYVDGVLYQTQTSWWSSGGAFPAPFDQPFYILMNLAVGGNFPGNPDTTTVFPAEIQVDYLRVYDFTSAAVPSLQFTAMQTLGGNLYARGSNGPPRATYYLLSSPNPSLPLAQWACSATNQFDINGGFTQPLRRATPATFYRLEVP